MELNYLKVAETVAVIVFFVIVKMTSFKIIDKTLNKRLLQQSRGEVIKRVLSIVFLSIALVFILIIWGVNQADLAVFMGSVLTIVGVAFFAQWSLLSNITSSIILFFNHPVRLYDYIMIMEAKEYVIEGQVTGIGLFFVTLETPDGAELTLPNNVFIQKSIKKINKEVEEKPEVD